MAFQQFCGSEFWVESLTWNTTTPDFTPCFQKTALVWIPCGFLWLFLPLEIYFLKKKTDLKFPCTGLNVTKVLFGCLLVLFSLFHVIHWMVVYSEPDVEIPYANINSPFISALTYLLATILMVVEKKKGIGSSGVLFIFWLLSAISKTFVFQSQLLTAINSDDYQSLADFITCMVSYPLIIAELILSTFVDTLQPDQRKGISEQNPCPETSSSFLSRLFFTWFDGMTWMGTKRPITRRDLWDLSPDNKSKHVVRRFQNSWQKELEKYLKSQEANKSPKEMPTIMHALWITFRWPFLIAGFLRLIADMLAFATPLILQVLIEYVTSDEPAWRGYFYAAVLACASLLQSVIYGQQYLLMFNTAMRVRSATISAIYRKALKINSSVKRSSTSGEIVNLMSVDVQRLMDLLPEIHVMWTAFIQIAVAMYMLWGHLGPSVLAGLATMILMIPINGLIASRFKILQVSQMKAKDMRVKVMNEVLNGMKVLKLYAWEPSFSDQISDIRGGELKVMKKGAYLNAAASFVFNTLPFMVTLATFATYVLVDEHNVLDAAKAFVSLSLFNIIRMPLFFIPMLFISMIQAGVSFKRMNKFLISNELDKDAVLHSENAEHPIIIDNGTFSWDKTEDIATLGTFNLTVETGSLVAVVGPVGCGKSSLASALLGDMDKITGSVNIKGSLAYVAQQAWIQNATLKDNILFGKPFDLDRYNKVIEACALKPDFDILPGGDATEIGEKGINLSGGQKQRVSLARAVYSDTDVLILDDPLSAVDSHVGKHIFEHIIGPTGMLKDKTRLFITNNITFLPRVDEIVVMKNGKMTEQGAYEELLEKKGDFAHFILEYLQEFEDNEMSEEELTDLEGIAHDVVTRIGSPALERQLSRKLSTAKSSIASDTEGTESEQLKKLASHRRSVSIHREVSERSKILPVSKIVQEEQVKLIQTESTETGRVKWFVYIEYLRATGYWTVACYLFSYTLNAGFLVGSNIWLSIWSEDPPLANNTQNIPLRDLRLGVYGAFGIGQALCILLGSFIMALGAIMASRQLHQRMLVNIMKCPMSFFDTTPLGRIVNRFSKDIDIVDTTIPMILRPLIGTALQVVSTLVVISMGTPIFMTMIIPVGIAFYIIQRFYISASRQLKRLESITRSPIFSYFSETISGSSTIRAYSREGEFIQESELRVDQNHMCYFPSIIANRWLAIRLELLSNIVIFSAALFAVTSKDTLSGGTIGLSISYAASLTNVLTFMVRMACDMETNIVAVERISEYADVPTEAEWEVEELDPPQTWPDKGAIVFQHYATRYRPGMGLVLKDVSCHIHSGERIGIVGRTGAGKSSLTLALFRIIEPADGTIFIDGVNTSLIGLHALRSKITIIPQDPVLFSGTLRMNLDPFNKHTDEELWMAINLSHMKAFVSTLTMGLEHHIAEGGENISVGQRQLLCLARALLRNTKILVLDEATAAIDMETDDLIQATIRKEFSHCTILTIAHRLNTIMDSTRIVVLDQGQICEFDTPATLLQNKTSVFYGMAKDAKLVQ